MAHKQKLRPKERDAIARLLRAVAIEGTHDDLEKLIKTTIEKIQFWVPHIRDQMLLFEQIDLPEDFQKQYRKTSKNVDEILRLIDHDYYRQQFGDYPPGLRTGLEKLKSMVQCDLPAGRGRKKTTPNKWLHELVRVLANLFQEVAQAEPTIRAKESFNPEDEVEPPNFTTAFEDFAHACTGPYGLKLTQYSIEQGVKLFRESYPNRRITPATSPEIP